MILFIDFQDSIQQFEGQQHSAMNRQRSPTQTCPCPARSDRNRVLMAITENLRNLIDCCRFDHDMRGKAEIFRFIAAIALKIFLSSRTPIAEQTREE